MRERAWSLAARPAAGSALAVRLPPAAEVEEGGGAAAGDGLAGVLPLPPLPLLPPAVAAPDCDASE